MLAKAVGEAAAQPDSLQLQNKVTALRNDINAAHMSKLHTGRVGRIRVKPRGQCTQWLHDLQHSGSVLRLEGLQFGHWSWEPYTAEVRNGELRLRRDYSNKILNPQESDKHNFSSGGSGPGSGTVVNRPPQSNQECIPLQSIRVAGPIPASAMRGIGNCFAIDVEGRAPEDNIWLQAPSASQSREWVSVLMQAWALIKEGLNCHKPRDS